MKTAVFYDLENIGLTSKSGGFEKVISDLQEQIKASDLVSDIVIQKAYMRRTHHALKQIEPIVAKHKIELVVVESLSESVHKKANMVDFKMCIDVTAVIAAKRSIGTVAVASGDNDFGFLCQQIKDMGKKLLVISRFNTTGDIMMKLCDDWIDLSEQVLTPKFIRNAIETRIRGKKQSGDFYSSFINLLQALENDVLVRRYMATFGLPLSQFIMIMQKWELEFPKYGELGFANLSSLLEALLRETNFECRSGIMKFSGINKKPLSQKRLIEGIIRLPTGYSREKLQKYYDLCAEVGNVDEFQTYITFMRRSGILKGSKLCNWRSFRATIRKHIRETLAHAGLVADEDALKEISKMM